MAHEFEVGDDRLHLAGLARQVFAVEAPPHAPVDAIGQRQNLVVHHEGIRREGGDEGRGEALQSGIEMTILAGEIIAGIAQGGVGGVLADMAGGIDDQILP